MAKNRLEPVYGSSASSDVLIFKLLAPSLCHYTDGQQEYELTLLPFALGGLSTTDEEGLDVGAIDGDYYSVFIREDTFLVETHGTCEYGSL